MPKVWVGARPSNGKLEAIAAATSGSGAAEGDPEKEVREPRRGRPQGQLGLGSSIE